jgi:hypothetical protein
MARRPPPPQGEPPREAPRRGAKGNVGAVKEIFRQLDKGELDTLSNAIANRRPGRAPAERAPRAEQPGKKAALEQAAGEVEGIYAPPPAPEAQPPLPITKH